MTSLPLSVAVPPPDLSDLDKPNDIELEELYFDNQDELRGATKKIWDEAGRFDRDPDCEEQLKNYGMQQAD